MNLRTVLSLFLSPDNEFFPDQLFSRLVVLLLGLVLEKDLSPLRLEGGLIQAVILKYRNKIYHHESLTDLTFDARFIVYDASIIYLAFHSYILFFRSCTRIP